MNPIEEKNYVTVGFSLTDRFDNRHSATSTVLVFDDLGDTELSVISRQFNAFLKQIGYIREKDCMFMNDITEEEAELLENYLFEIRKNGVK